MRVEADNHYQDTEKLPAQVGWLKLIESGISVMLSQSPKY
jgi:hypothetical protein